MFSYHVSRVIHEERQREIERNLAFRRSRRTPNPISIRRRVGNGVIRIGSVIAADGGQDRPCTDLPAPAPLQLAARR